MYGRKRGEIRMMLRTLHEVFPYYSPADKFNIDRDAKVAVVKKVGARVLCFVL